MLSDSSDLLEIVFKELIAHQVHGVAGFFGEEHIKFPSMSEGVHDQEIQPIVTGRTHILNPHFRTLCHTQDSYDIEVNFVMKNVLSESWEIAQREIHALAMQIASDCDITIYFGGLDPARDIDTRLFTKNELGPWIL